MVLLWCLTHHRLDQLAGHTKVCTKRDMLQHWLFVFLLVAMIPSSDALCCLLVYLSVTVKYDNNNYSQVCQLMLGTY